MEGRRRNFEQASRRRTQHTLPLRSVTGAIGELLNLRRRVKALSALTPLPRLASTKRRPAPGKLFETDHKSGWAYRGFRSPDQSLIAFGQRAQLTNTSCSISG